MAMTGAGLTAARQAAKDAAVAAWVASPTTPAQLAADMLAADSDAIVAYVQANAIASFTAATVGVGLTAGPNPVVGALTVAGGTIA